MVTTTAEIPGLRLFVDLVLQEEQIIQAFGLGVAAGKESPADLIRLVREALRFQMFAGTHQYDSRSQEGDTLLLHLYAKPNNLKQWKTWQGAVRMALYNHYVRNRRVFAGGVLFVPAGLLAG